MKKYLLYSQDIIYRDYITVKVGKYHKNTVFL